MVVVGHSLDCMNMSQIFVSFICNQWWLAKDFGHLCMCLQKTPVLQNDVPYTIVEGWYRRLEISLSSAAVTQLTCNICCPRISFKAFLRCSWGSIYWWRSQSFHQQSPRNMHHLNTSDEGWGTVKMEWNTVFGTRVVRWTVVNIGMGV